MTVTPEWASWGGQVDAGDRGSRRGGRARAWAAAALVLAGLAGAARADGAPEEPRARLDLGVGGAEHGFRLSLDGGRPHGTALLVVRERGGARHTQMVPLDAHGHGEVVHRRWRAERDCEALFVTANKGGANATTSVTVPGATSSGNVLVQRGDVLINEFLKDPKSVSDTSGEWVELWNATNRTVNVEGWWLLDDGGDQHMLYNGAQGIYLQPGQYFVLARKADPATNGGVNVDYVYNGFSLSNGDDEIRLVSRGGVLVDEVLYDDGVFWPDDPGKAIGLDPARRAANLNDDPANWCHAQTPIAAGNPDLGTPGSRNDTCP